MTLSFLPESMSAADSAMQKGKANKKEGEIERERERAENITPSQAEPGSIAH